MPDQSSSSFIYFCQACDSRIYARWTPNECFKEPFTELWILESSSLFQCVRQCSFMDSTEKERSMKEYKTDTLSLPVNRFTRLQGRTGYRQREYKGLDRKWKSGHNEKTNWKTGHSFFLCPASVTRRHQQPLSISLLTEKKAAGDWRVTGEKSF